MSVAGAGYLAAFAGGLVSFASPCVLPLVPAYLSVITGLEISEIEQGPRHHLWRIAGDTGVFIAGLAVVCIMLGLTATARGQALVARQALITRISGLLVLAFALLIAGSLVLKSPLLYQERRFRPRLSRYGPLAAPVAVLTLTFGERHQRGWRSGLAGRRASARCSARCWPLPRPRPARCRGPRCSRPTRWAWGCRSSRPGWPSAGWSARSAGLSGTTPRSRSPPPAPSPSSGCC